MREIWSYHSIPGKKNTICTDTLGEANDFMNHYIPYCLSARSGRVDFYRNPTTGMVTLTASPQIIRETKRRLNSLKKLR